MKKIITILLIFLLVACGQKDPKSEIKDALKKTLNNANTYTLKAEGTMNIGDSAVTMKIPYEITMMYDLMAKADDDPDTYMLTKITQMGQTATSETWTTKEKVYSIVNGVYSTSDVESSKDGFEIDQNKMFDMFLDEAKSIDKQDNKYTVTFDKLSFTDLDKKISSGSGLSGFLYGGEDTDAYLNSLIFNLNDDNTVNSYEMTIELNDKSQDIKGDMNVEYKFVDINSTEIPLIEYETFKRLENTTTCYIGDLEEEGELYVNYYYSEKGIVKEIEYTVFLDYESYGWSDEEIIELVEEIKEGYANTKGVTYEYYLLSGVIQEITTVNLDEADAQELFELGILEDSTSTIITKKDTMDSLNEEGWYCE